MSNQESEILGKLNVIIQKVEKGRELRKQNLDSGDIFQDFFKDLDGGPSTIARSDNLVSQQDLESLEQKITSARERLFLANKKIERNSALYPFVGILGKSADVGNLYGEKIGNIIVFADKEEKLVAEESQSRFFLLYVSEKVELLQISFVSQKNFELSFKLREIEPRQFETGYNSSKLPLESMTTEELEIINFFIDGYLGGKQ